VRVRKVSNLGGRGGEGRGIGIDFASLSSPPKNSLINI